MGELKDSWKNTGKGLGHAFRDLGKSLVKTASTTAKKVDDWASGEEKATSEEKKTEE